MVQAGIGMPHSFAIQNNKRPHNCKIYWFDVNDARFNQTALQLSISCLEKTFNGFVRQQPLFLQKKSTE